MAWKKFKEFNYTKQPDPHLKAGYSAMVTGHYYVNFKGTLYVDTTNNAHYRVQCTMKVAPYKSKYGGYWTDNDGTGIEVYFSDSKGNHTILEKDISSSSYPISAWQTAGEYVTVDSIDTEFTIERKGTLNLYIQLWQSGAGRVGSNSWVVEGKTVTSSDGFSGTYSNFIDYEIPDPYKKPTLSISGDNISRYDLQRSITIDKNTSGDSEATNVKVTINGNSHDTSLGNTGGNYNFTPKNENNVGESSSYNVTVRRTHSKDSTLYKEVSKTLYTYKIPTITDFSLDPSTISGCGGGNLKWSCNNKKWSDTSLEKQFKTYIYNSKRVEWNEASTHAPTNINAPNTAQSQAMSKTWIDNILTNNEKCADSVSFKIKMRRKNESSGQVADTSELTLTINYKPTKTIGDNSIIYYDCKSDNTNPDTTKQLYAGNEYYIDEHPYVYVRWTYPDDLDGGVISGYLFKVYTDSSCSTEKYSTVVTTTEYQTGVPLNIKTDLKRGSINYVGITPFYTDPNGTKRYGSESTKKFIKPIGRLHKPVIDGPISGTNWHNNQFRILVTSPVDDDFDVEQVDFDITANSYRYKNIELNINGTVYTFENNINIFSTDDLSYIKPLVINPSLVNNFPNIGTYNIKIRFQKNYYSEVWSDWSDTITVNNSVINEITQSQGIKKQEKVLLNHYTTVRNYSVRLYDVYFINRNNLPSTNKALSAEAIIKAENYQGIYDSILQIQNRVNNYATFDSNKTNVRFNKNIDNFAGNNKPIRGEIITQDKISNDPVGRNYMNICIECMNKLSN